MGMLIEQRVSQVCDLCKQEILPERQLPLNAIVVEGHKMCPSCRQPVSVLKQNDPKYIRKWQQYVNGLKLDM